MAKNRQWFPRLAILLQVEPGEFSFTCVCIINFKYTARITQINPRWVRYAILCVKDIVLAEPFRGQSRKDDVRATKKYRVEMYKCFRPNDIILVRVGINGI